MAASRQTLTVEGREITVSNLEKILYPAAKFRKGQVIDYYVRISECLLPHLQDRPCTLKRYPDGVRGEFFWEKDAPGYTPEWVRRFSVSRRGRPGDIHYILINDLPTLVWAANAASLELHPFLHRAPRIEYPTSLVFDLDPGPGADILTCIQAASFLRELLDELTLRSFAKVSGSKGLQVYVPLNGDLTYAVVEPFAKAVAELMAQRHPGLIVSKMSKSVRAGKVFIDWSQNTEVKTTVAVYSLRAKRDRPYVSLPVTWDELIAALRAKDASRLYFEPEEVLKRVKKTGDLFAPVESLKQDLPPAVRMAARQASGSLEAYRKKRDFSRTPEPPPLPPARSAQGSRRRFVIQKHAASHLHYDFRLEIGGALKSWAVPKGPPYTTDTKRLAMATEDHPLEYLEFEGTIPKGQYGGGTVMVWDIGTYEIMEGNYYRGYLHIYLRGKKLNGEWSLIRSREEGQNNKWYLAKVHSGMRPVSQKQDDKSAVSGRTMQQIANSADRQWESNRKSSQFAARSAGLQPGTSPNADSAGRGRRYSAAAPETELDLSSLPTAKLEFIEPMLAEPVSTPPEGPWVYEIKLDGYRAMVVKNKTHLTLFSRRGHTLNRRFPAIANAFGRLSSGTILDGEIVALDEQGRPQFNALQNARDGQAVYFYAFDLLAYQGKDLLSMRLSDRRQLLEQALRGLEDPVRLSPIFDFPAREVARAARDQGLEGIVAKRVDSLYEPGLRTGNWVKYKTQKGQELVVGGYLPGSQVFDSLLVGYYENSRLMFLAKVRNGFTPSMRLEIAKKFERLEARKCPFANLPEPKSARRGKALTKEVMRECRWLEPKLVAQVEFTDWTAGNHLRHARFVALRDDKDAREVRRETP